MFRNRSILMCFAIIGVIIYHLALRGIPLGRLNIGYMGVDVFMLLSGYGIFKSLQKNSLSTYYVNRIKKILPLWTFLILFDCFFKILVGGGSEEHVKILLSNITTLSFYFNPDLLPEWYLATLILFYALSPLLKFGIDKMGYYFLYAMIIVVLSIIFLVNISTWQYANALPRFLLYLLGMTCAAKRQENMPFSITVPLFVVGCFFFFQNAHYLFSICCILLIIQMANLLISRYAVLNNTFFDWIGKHTLEIYVGNTMSAIVLDYWLQKSFNASYFIAYDVGLTVSLGLFLILLNKKIGKCYAEKIY